MLGLGVALLVRSDVGLGVAVLGLGVAVLGGGLAMLRAAPRPGSRPRTTLGEQPGPDQ